VQLPRHRLEHAHLPPATKLVGNLPPGRPHHQPPSTGAHWAREAEAAGFASLDRLVYGSHETIFALAELTLG
jgi:hypothetical protein